MTHWILIARLLPREYGGQHRIRAASVVYATKEDAEKAAYDAMRQNMPYRAFPVQIELPTECEGDSIDP